MTDPEILDPTSYPHIPAGEPIPEPIVPEPVVVEEPTIPEELIPLSTYPVNSVAVSNLFDRHARPAPVGETNRKTLTFTITLQTDQEWRDFLETYTGTQPQRGVGISSPMVELAMQMLMGVIAEFKLDEIAQALREISTTPLSKQNVKDNLDRLAERI